MPTEPEPQSTHVIEDQSQVLAWLTSAAAFDGDEAPVRIDTHAAVVLLAGEHAYKVKRAVRFPFLDFSTLKKREGACRAEVAINSVYAPDLYEGVVAVRNDGAGLRLADADAVDAGAIVEWAVKMRRFALEATLDRVADAGGLTPALVAALADVVARSHAAGERRPDPAQVDINAMYLDQNEEAFAAQPELFPPERVRRIIAEGRRAFSDVRELLAERAVAGLVRRCHGDLHLRNIVLIEGKPTLFDAIEFDERIATCDVLYDLAFLLMDLIHRGYRSEANLLFNRYLWQTDQANLAGLAALPLFLSIRASIRAKVTAAGLGHLSAVEQKAEAKAIAGYFALAQDFLQPTPPRLIAVGGLSGTGKSTLAGALAPFVGRAPGAVHLRSDIERKRLFGVAETARLPQQAYEKDAGEAVYAILARKAAAALEGGAAVIVDAVYARAHERAAIEAVAQSAGVPFSGLWLEAPQATLTSRVSTRRNDASDATADVVRAQQGYETGKIGWQRIDASGSAAGVTATARSALDL